MVQAGTWLVSLAGPIARQVLISLGVGVVTFVGLQAAVSSGLGAAKAALSGLPADAAQIAAPSRTAQIAVFIENNQGVATELVVVAVPATDVPADEIVREMHGNGWARKIRAQRIYSPRTAALIVSMPTRFTNLAVRSFFLALSR